MIHRGKRRAAHFPRIQIAKGTDGEGTNHGDDFRAVEDQVVDDLIGRECGDNHHDRLYVCHRGYHRDRKDDKDLRPKWRDLEIPRNDRRAITS